MSDIRKVAVLGTGVLGSQIAFQTAYSGFDVVAYDISEEALERARARHLVRVGFDERRSKRALCPTMSARVERLRSTSSQA